jgi:hypothetical protein
MLKIGFGVMVAGVVAAAACGSKDPGATATTTTSTATSTGSSGGSSTATSSMSSTGSGVLPDCKGPEPKNPGKSIDTGVIKVTVKDAMGKGLGDALINVQMCGTNSCTYGKSTDGVYSLESAKLTDPALKYGSQAEGPYLFWGGALPMMSFDYGTVTAVDLGAPGGKLVKGMTVTANDVSLTLGADTNVELELSAPEQPFRAKVFKPSDGTFPPLAATTQKFELVVGLGPAEVDICPPAKLTFPNVLAWPAKTAVALWLNSVKTYDHYAPYGSWAKVADAVVSDDGKTISTTSSSGIPALGAYGVVKL